LKLSQEAKKLSGSLIFSSEFLREIHFSQKSITNFNQEVFINLRMQSLRILEI